MKSSTNGIKAGAPGSNSGSAQADHGKNGNGKTEAASILRTQVSTVFGELSRVQEELQGRLQEFGALEAELVALKEAVECEQEKLDEQKTRVEELNKQTEKREKSFAARAKALDQREAAVQSFQTMLVRMAAALEDPTSANLSVAFEAATGALRDGHAASLTPTVVEDYRPSPAISATGNPAGKEDLENDPDLSDLTPEELHRLNLLRQLGTASVAEIAEQLRSERNAAPSEPEEAGRKKGGKLGGWLS